MSARDDERLSQDLTRVPLTSVLAQDTVANVTGVPCEPVVQREAHRRTPNQRAVDDSHEQRPGNLVDLDQGGTRKLIS